jgi:hypothetical protein
VPWTSEPGWCGPRFLTEAGSIALQGTVIGASLGLMTAWPVCSGAPRPLAASLAATAWPAARAAPIRPPSRCGSPSNRPTYPARFPVATPPVLNHAALPCEPWRTRRSRLASSARW